MEKHNISIPFYKELTKERNWKSINKKKFFISRLNLVIKEKQICNKIYNGEIIQGFSSPLGERTIEEIEYEEELSKIDFLRTINNYIVTQRNIENYINELGIHLGLDKFAKIDNSFKFSSKKLFEETFNKNITFESSSTTSIKRKYKVTKEFVPEKYEKVYAVIPYKKVRYEVFLSFVDYLLVEYSCSMLGFRKKRVKHPCPNLKRNFHNNKIIYKQPLFVADIWKPLDNNSIWLVPEDKYQLEVQDPNSIFMKPFNNCSKKQYIEIPPYSFKDIPTLYQLSNAAFPLKWIKRKGDWTIDELKELELLEYQKKQNLGKLKVFKDI